MPFREPAWLLREEVESVHDLQLELNGGLGGLRDAGALESALGRPRHRWAYNAAEDLADCAAAYGFAIAKNHAFNDGNKRTAFVSMAVFLERNGLSFVAAEADAVITMLAVATGDMSEARLADWLRANVQKRSRPRRKK